MSVNHLQKMMLSMIHIQGLSDQAKQWVSGGLAKNDGDAKDDIVNVKLKSVAVGKLVPIQEQIYLINQLEMYQSLVLKVLKTLQSQRIIFTLYQKIIEL